MLNTVQRQALKDLAQSLASNNAFVLKAHCKVASKNFSMPWEEWQQVILSFAASGDVEGETARLVAISEIATSLAFTPKYMA
jgi:type IV secretory pathway VirB2 component (pilin)